MTIWTHPDVAAWADRANRMRVNGPNLAEAEVAVFDVAPADTGPLDDPLVIIHGFPTSSFDWAHLVDRLADRRRVVLVDLPGFGLSDKPNQRYTIAGAADAVVSVCAQLGQDRFALLTHDMGDTVGGELLARQMEGVWDVTVTRRIVTNGSIYIDMAHLTDGQLLLLSLPDEPGATGPGPELIAASLVATLSAGHRDVDMSGAAELVCHNSGDTLLARTIRYIEERRTNEARFTGAIEAHPSPLSVIWGPEDPIAVAAMTDRLLQRRPDAQRIWIDGAGHYPQNEAPEAYLAAVRSALT